MKHLVFAIMALVVFTACKNEPKKVIETQSQKIAAVTDAMMENGIIYEANIRQYSPEGTFNAFTKDIPELKKLGVNTIWLMPINAISEIKRKATDGSFTSDIKDEKERAKYLGSYYSVSDYKAINPEFGTKADFDNLVKTAHDNGIYVMVDWVPNHTGWDHPWITAHPEWYTQNAKGEIIDPINPDTGKSWGWTDVADLNYDNRDMQLAMINDLKYWVEHHDIDGYRMDVAHKVPPKFFNEAIAEMRKIKPLFMLAEAEQQVLFRNGFDMQYAWEGHHLLNKIAKEEKTANDFDTYMLKQDSVMQNEDFKMNFVTNHDENSWNGTIKERLGKAGDLYTALTYIMPGMPLIYSGQEYDLNHRLLFFEKDEIPHTKGSTWQLLEKLGKLKTENEALNGGKQDAAYQDLNQDKNVIAFSRTKGNNTVVFIANISSTTIETTIPTTGLFTDYFSGEVVTLDGKSIALNSLEFRVLVAK